MLASPPLLPLSFAEYENVRVRSFSSPAFGYAPTPRPRPRGGVPSSEEESYLSFHSLPHPQSGEDCSPYCVEVFLETFGGHSFLGAGTSSTHSAFLCASFLFRALFFVRVSLPVGKRAPGGKFLTFKEPLVPVIIGIHSYETTKTKTFR